MVLNFEVVADLRILCWFTLDATVCGVMTLPNELMQFGSQIPEAYDVLLHQAFTNLHNGLLSTKLINYVQLQA